MNTISRHMFMDIPRSAAVMLLWIALQPSALAQINLADADPYLQLGETNLSRYRVGVSITASRGPVQNVVAMVAVPYACPEQTVEIVDVDVTSGIEHDYRTLPQGGARQLLLKIPYLPSGEEAHAIITYEVRTSTIMPPEETEALTIPTKPDGKLKRFLGRSPFIETKHSKIKKVVRQVMAELKSTEEPGVDELDGEEEVTAKNALASNKLPTSEASITAWQRVEAIYDYVQGAVDYVEGPDKSAVKTLQDGFGDCQNISALFVAMCRTHKVPARIVWVHEHNYAEFCLVDAEGKPHWFPCESSGTRAFGEMPLARTILQKGDNFRVPERPRDRLRYASNFMVAEGLPGSGKPKVRYIQQQL